MTDTTPNEIWLRPNDSGGLYVTNLTDERDAVKYLRADYAFEKSAQALVKEAARPDWDFHFKLIAEDVRDVMRYCASVIRKLKDTSSSV